MHTLHIALVGPTGVGKGTHGARLAEQLGLNCCATGNLLRDNLARRTAVGFLAQPFIERSEPVPDNIVSAMIAEWIVRTDGDRGILFTGYPRTRAQAEALDSMLLREGRSLDGVCNLEISDRVVKQRLTGRIVCRECGLPYHRSLNPPLTPDVCDQCGGRLTSRAEDIPELIKVRLRNYRRSQAPLLDYYLQSGRLININAEGSIPEVENRLDAAATQVQARSEITEDSALAEARGVALHSGRMIAVEEVERSGFDVILLGGPGSGKGTQAERLRNHLGLPHIATGDLFRENLKQKTSLGELAKTYMDRGALVPDDVTEAMVEERLARPDTAAGFILDGFPRTINQAHALADIMNALRRRVSCVLYIRVSDEEILRRLSGRLICRDCQTPYHVDFKPPLQTEICDLCGGALYQRDDDNPKTVRTRLHTFHEQTGPIVNYYHAAGVLKEIDGEGRPDDVVQRTIAVVDAVAAG